MNNEVNIKHNKIEVEDGHIVFGKSKKRVKKNALQLLKATAMELKPVRDITENESIDKDIKEDEKRTKEIALLKKQMATPGQTVNQFLLQKYSDNINTAVSLIDQYDNSPERIKAGLNYEYHVYFPTQEEFDSYRVDNKYIIIGPIKDFRLGDLYYYHIPIYVKEHSTTYTTDFSEELNLDGTSKNKDGLVNALNSFKTAIEKQSLTLNDDDFKIVKSYGLLTTDNKIKLDIVGNMKVEKYLLSIAPDKREQALEYLNSISDIKEERVSKLQEQYDELIEKASKLEKENEELKKKSNTIEDEINKEKSDIEKIKKDITNQNKAKSKLKNKNNIIKKEKHIKRLEDEVEQKTNDLKNVVDELKDLEKDIEKKEEEIGEVSNNMESVTERIDTIIDKSTTTDDEATDIPINGTEFSGTMNYNDDLSLYENLIANDFKPDVRVRSAVGKEELRVSPMYIIEPYNNTFYIILDKFGINPGIGWKTLSEINKEREDKYIEMIKNNKLKHQPLSEDHKRYIKTRKLSIKGDSPFILTKSSEFMASPPDVVDKIKTFYNNNK